MTEPLIITEPTVVMLDLTARPTQTGFVSINLGFFADPIAFTPAVIKAEKAKLPGWKWRKEYLRDAHAQAGIPAFDADALNLAELKCRNPLYCMDIEGTGKDMKLVRRAKGRIKIYLEPDAQPPNLPDSITEVTRACGMGIDVGAGVEKSDTAIELFFADTREQAAELACNRITPTDAGRVAALLARYYNNAFICCVSKMHGLTVIRAIADEMKYPYLWHSRIANRIIERKTDKLGWGGRELTDLLFDPWDDAIIQGVPTIYSILCLQDHKQYVYDERGKRCHQKVVYLPQEIRDRHGDRVVACALAQRACDDLPRYRAVVKRAPDMVEELLAKRRQQRASPWRR